MEERVALVTGSGKGVGAGIVRFLAMRGIRCCMNCHSNPELAEKNRAAISEQGGQTILVQADVSDPAGAEMLVEKTLAAYGRLDILVNNAALQLNRYLDEYTVDALQSLWNVNVGGYLNMVQYALPALRKSPCARIINISSIHGKRPTGFDPGYAMCKGAVRMFTRELALELKKDHIPVNAIDLGGCKIEFKTGNPPFRMRPIPGTKNPELDGPWQVLPEEVGSLVYYLASPEAEAVNGSGIRIDRGLVLI